MKSFRKKSSGLACAAAITGAMLAPAAEAVNLATDGIGEVAIAPYYTVRDGWLSLINVTNTADVPVVVKIRFHESRNSRDVLDINVALSAFDVFSAVVKEAADGSGPVLELTDFVPGSNPPVLDTCAIPHRASFPMAPGGQLAFSGPNDDGGPQDANRLREGYIEFISMGFADPASPIGVAIESHWCNSATTPVGFTSVESSFNSANILTTARQFGEPINTLKYNYRLLNPGRGVEVAGAAVTWANFYNPGGTAGANDPQVPDGLVTPAANAACTVDRGAERRSAVDWDPAGGGGSCRNLITAQVPFDFLEPSLNDAYPVDGNFWDDGTNAPVSVFPSTADTYRVVTGAPGVRGVDALSATIQRASVINEWSNESALGVTTDWVVTFPTKGFFVDQTTDSSLRQFALVPGDRDEAIYNPPANLVPYPPFSEAFHQETTGDRSTAQSCNNVRFARYDRAENTLGETGEVIPSPAPVLPTDQLCYEANVVTFSATSALGTANPRMIDVSALPGDAGWVSLVLDEDPFADPLSALGAPFTTGGIEGWSGLPTIGFMVKQRMFPQGPSKNFASSIDHGYKRCFQSHLNEAGVNCEGNGG
ncbi:MAG: hypothetical protein ACU843_04660 [Gammaproteobacteria bacterium]